MKVFTWFVVMSLITLGVNAHGVDISTMVLVEQEDHTWDLQVRSSLDAFRREVKMHFSESPYQTPEQFEEQLLAHFCNTLKITVNDETDISLDYGVVKLGHETVVFFDQIILPENITSIKLAGDMFKDINRSKIRLLVIKEGFEKTPFILDQKNDYSISLAVQESSFVENVKQDINFPLMPVLIPIAFIIAFIIVVRLSKSKSLRLQFNS